MKHLIFIGLLVLSQYSLAQMEKTAPAPPVYETCQQVAVSDGNGGTYMQPDQACLSRNAIKQRDYNYAVNAYNRGTRIVNSDSTGLVKPAEPQYETCVNTDSDGNTIYDQACEGRNQAKQRDYSIQTSGYNEAVQRQQAEQQAAQSEEQRRLAEQARLDSAKAAAEAAQSKNEESSKIYQLASLACSATSTAFAGAYAGSCAAGGSCQQPLLTTSIAFAIFSGLASQQSASNSGVAYNACTVAAKVGTADGNCGAPPDKYNPATYPSTQNTGLTSLFGSDGSCIGAQADCNRVIGNLPIGVNIKDVMKDLKTFAAKPPFKVNPDGSVTTKDGKTYTAANFASVKDMMAAGMSEAAAKDLFAKLNKNSALDARSILAKENKAAAGLADSSSTGTTKDKGALLNGNASAGKDIGSKRSMASAEGLARDFNGDMIGVAGDDIFKMMNRRYKLKTSQDNFIAAP